MIIIISIHEISKISISMLIIGKDLELNYFKETEKVSFTFYFGKNKFFLPYLALSPLCFHMTKAPQWFTDKFDGLSIYIYYNHENLQTRLTNLNYPYPSYQMSIPLPWRPKPSDLPYLFETDSWLNLLSFIQFLKI